MIKTKIIAALTVRAIIMLLMCVCLPVFFVIYILCLLGETYLNAFFAYVTNCREALIQYDKQLNP